MDVKSVSLSDLSNGVWQILWNSWDTAMHCTLLKVSKAIRGRAQTLFYFSLTVTDDQGRKSYFYFDNARPEAIGVWYNQQRLSHVRKFTLVNGSNVKYRAGLSYGNVSV